MKDFEKLLKAAVARVETGDRRLADELKGVRESRSATARRDAAPFLESTTQDAPQLPPQLALETIVLKVGRPVLAVVHGAARLEFTDSESEVWRARLEAVGDMLQRAARSVGRIELSGHPQLDWVGTGWMVGREIIVTNRHVAREFGRRNGEGFTFSQGFAGRTIKPSIDFLEEIGSDESLAFPIVEILHIEDDDGPDMALLRVEETSDRPFAPPISMSGVTVVPEQQVAVIGYPARDSRIPDQALMQSIFGDVYNKKRLAPGQITRSDENVLLHDCSTLGGNSGSVVLDLATGQAVGLHFAGRFLEANFAVPAKSIAVRLVQVGRRRYLPRPDAAVPPPRPAGTHSSGAPSNEGVPADYIGRKGYDAAFLGARVDVPLPEVTNHDDVLTFDADGSEAHELKYQHFSVVMSRSRRMCFLSAVNIDGQLSRRGKRPGWRNDPRIPNRQQIRDECYGDEPRFSRGHMTRREDPVWGEPDEAALGNADSMHVTNTVPQMQPFNAGIWLALEDYALEHAREDSMRISVFTGPFLLADDPIRFEVKVPCSFWKVIAFIHDETHELCATGYTMSQEDFLREEEFVFGQHATTQTPIRTIEQRAGVSFGQLRSFDPLDTADEAIVMPLRDFSQITFLRR